MRAEGAKREKEKKVRERKEKEKVFYKSVHMFFFIFAVVIFQIYKENCI